MAIEKVIWPLPPSKETRERNERKEAARQVLADFIEKDVSELQDSVLLYTVCDPQNAIGYLMIKGYITQAVIVNDVSRYTIGNLLKNVK